MTIAQVLKKAAAAQKKLEKAEAEAKVANTEREAAIREALPLVTTVSQAVKVFHLTKEKRHCTLAWQKAVTLLRPQATAVEDLVLITQCKFGGTQKDHDFCVDLARKKELILESASDEQLDVLYEAFPSQYRFELKDRLEARAANCTSEEQLDALAKHYERFHINAASVVSDYREKMRNTD